MRRLIVGLVITLALPGCAGHVPPNAAPEAKVAIYAADVMTGVREVVRLTAVLESATVVKTDDAAQVMIVAERIGKAGQQLSVGLKVYHDASDLATKKLALAEVLKTLDAIDANLKSLLKPLDRDGAKARYLDTITGIVKAVWAIRVSLPVGV